jgi:MFS family permease
MISEISTPKTQARAFSFFAFASYLGLFVGPLLGGFLADPAHQFPSLFGGVPFFEQHPYALPTLLIGCFGGSAALICALFAKEVKYLA